MAGTSTASIVACRATDLRPGDVMHPPAGRRTYVVRAVERARQGRNVTGVYVHAGNLGDEVGTKTFTFQPDEMVAVQRPADEPPAGPEAAPRPGPAGTAGEFPPPLRFVLVRHEDVTGVSGTGVVADGVRWADGSAVVHWRGDRASTVIWSSMADVEAIHGHHGATTVEWLDTW